MQHRDAVLHLAIALLLGRLGAAGLTDPNFTLWSAFEERTLPSSSGGTIVAVMPPPFRLGSGAFGSEPPPGEPEGRRLEGLGKDERPNPGRPSLIAALKPPIGVQGKAERPNPAHSS